MTDSSAASSKQVNGHGSSLSASTSSLASTSASGSSTVVSNGSARGASSSNTSTHPDACSSSSSDAAATEAAQLADSSQSLVNHLYQVGFLQAHWTDLALHIASVTGFRLSVKAHALVLVRSPFLSQLICSSVGHEIVIPVEDSHITEESINIALAHLYGGPTLTSVTRSNALAVLAAAIFLQLDDVASLALQRASHITLPDLPATLSFCAAHSDTGNDAHAQASAALLQAADEFLVRELPKSLGAWGAAGEKGVEELARAYATLEFGMLRSVIESSELPVRNDQERFVFAKKVAALRKALRSNAASRATLHPDDVAVEENVVMAFGQGGGSNVRFMRKAARPGRFQKVAASAV